MTVSPAGFERVSVKIRLVVPELPSTTAASFASRKGRVCARAIRLRRQSSSSSAAHRTRRVGEKLAAATIPNTVGIHSGSVRFLQFFSTQPTQCRQSIVTPEHTAKQKPRSCGVLQKLAAYFLR